jgi:hypothetical protein
MLSNQKQRRSSRKGRKNREYKITQNSDVDAVTVPNTGRIIETAGITIVNCIFNALIAKHCKFVGDST